MGMHSSYDEDLADDDLHRIVTLKEQLVDLLDGMKRQSGNSDPVPLQVMEQEFDDMFHKEWHRLTAISGSIEWTTEIPSCETLRFMMAKRHKRPFAQNPETHQAKGDAL